MKSISFFFILLVLAGCSADVTTAGSKTDSTKIDSVIPDLSTTVVPGMACPEAANMNELQLPYVDSIETKGSPLTKEIYKSYRFEKLGKFDPESEYFILGRVMRGGKMLFVVSKNSANEVTHWIVSVSADSCKMIDHKMSAYGDFVESMSETKTEIGESEIKIIQTNYDYSDSVPKTTIKTKILKLTEEGKFEKVK